MTFFYLSRTDIQHRLSCRLLANKKTMVGIFVPSLLAIMIVPLCYSSPLTDRHHPDGRKLRIESNDGKTRNSTLTVTEGKPAANADFPSVGNGDNGGNGGKGGFFYSPPPRGGGGGRPSGLFEIDPTILQPVVKWPMPIGKDSADGRQAGNVDSRPSGSRPNAGSNDATNHHQQEKREAPENRDNTSPGENNGSSADGNNRKDDNGEESKNNALTHDLQVIANELLAIIESDDPNAAFKFREMLDKLEVEQRVQVLKTKGTNISGNTITPLKAILALPRSAHEDSTRNRFIKHLIESAGYRYLMVFYRNKLLMILYNIVLDIIHKVNQSHQQPPIEHFEKRCFAEYFIQLLLIYSNPVERIRNLLEEISDLAIRNEIINDAQSLIFPKSFVDTLAQSDHQPSFHELMRLSDEVRIQAQYGASETIDDYIAISAFGDNALRVDKEEPTDIIGAECTVCKEQFVRTSNIVKTPCNHLYHVDCLNKWLKRREQNHFIKNCPTCRTELNAFSKKLDDFDKLLKKYRGFHSLAIAKRAVNNWNKAETSHEALYHFVQFCRHSSQASDDSQFVKLLRRIFHPVTKAEIRHHDAINSATFSANNRLVVTASDDGTAKIYAYQSDGSWKEELTIRHDGCVNVASFSADSSRVLTASDDGTAQIHVQKEGGSWEEEMIIRHAEPINLATFDDSSRVLTASDDGTAKIHVQKEGGSWEEEGSINHDGSIYLASFSADGSHVVTAGEDKVVKITGKSADGLWQVKFIVIHESPVNSAIFSPDNRYVVTASNDGTANIIARKDDESWEEELTISHIHTNGQMKSAAFSPDSRHVLTVGWDNLVKIIGKRADGTWVVKAIISHSDLINSATFSPDSQHAVTTSDDGTAKVHSHKNDGSWEEGLNIHHAYPITSVAFSADGRFVITFGLDGVAKIKCLNGALQINIRHPDAIHSASFSPDSRFVQTQSFLPESYSASSIVKITELWKEE
ncbi:RING finger domain-containing protein [Endozoicomonas sp. 4G]|uniref:RING finger domain-containing protein n=1 Tax=Endozoicomonas sp. 4G TaxID=2872754 RepID=UPI00207861DA|nr:RING finger domain-containing protein [Endozoicomonas sp. 4G]